MILEGLVSTRNADGTPHLAPMGPRVEGVDFQRFELRPFPTSQTYQNLLKDGRGVLHVTDDALLIARAAIGRVGTAHHLEEGQPIRKDGGQCPPYETVLRLADCHRYYEFQVISIDTSNPRVVMACEVTQSGQGTRPWFGFNRARHAVLEAAILATRVHLLPRLQIETEFKVLQLIVDKTGGSDEKTAMKMLQDHVRSHG